MTPHLAVVEPGLLTTVQDLGRHGLQALGIPVSGAMDPMSLRIANALVGNPDETAGLEISVLGPTFRVDAQALRVALVGGDTPIEILSEPRGTVPPQRSVRLTSGQVFRVGALRDTAYVYLAVEGGFDLPSVGGSLSTYVRGGFGGMEGRALARADRLPLCLHEAPHRREAHFPGALPFTRAGVIRVVLGPQDASFTSKGIQTFLGADYTVTPQSDRMGLRLAGPSIEHAGGHDILSEGIALGSIQVPGNGLPIILVADHQTTGGYPKIATVASADVPRLARTMPGQRLSFSAVTADEARVARRALEAALQACKQAIEPFEERSLSEKLTSENLISGVTIGDA